MQGTKRFYSMVVSMEVRELIVDGNRACALTHYELQAPGGAPPFDSDVAEVFGVANDKIQSFDIYFDSAPYPKG
ncbi:MAG: nuclear transport factor 2 family protein [Gemmatimonadaceae bacterium]